MRMETRLLLFAAALLGSCRGPAPAPTSAEPPPSAVDPSYDDDVALADARRKARDLESQGMVVEIHRRSVDEAERMLRSVRDLHEAGRVPQAQLAEAETRLSESRSALVEAERALAEIEAR